MDTRGELVTPQAVMSCIPCKAGTSATVSVPLPVTWKAKRHPAWDWQAAADLRHHEQPGGLHQLQLSQSRHQPRLFWGHHWSCLWCGGPALFF